MSRDLKSNPLPAGPMIQGQAVQMNSPDIQIPSVSSRGSVGGNAIGGNAIGATIGLLGNLIGDSINYRRQKKMYETQRQDALSDYEMQREDYLEDLASERAYNSPAAQKARLLEAGINPNIAFGNGHVANTSSDAENTAGVRSSVFASPASNSGLGSGLIASGLDMIRGRDMESDILVKQASVAKLLKEAGILDTQHSGYKLDNISKEIANKFADAMYESDLREKSARTSQLLDSLKTSAMLRLESKFRLENILPAQQNQIKALAEHYFAQVSSINQQMEYFDSVKEARKRIEYKELSYKSLESAEREFESMLYKVLGDNIKDKNSFLDFFRDYMIYSKFLWKGL